jgi:uncharacterized coiled-coil protein SlyX
MSITTSPTPPTAEERLTELELRYTLQEETLRELSDVLLSQGRELEIPALLPALLDEKPPHY